MRHYKILLFCLISTVACADTFEQMYAAYADKLEECSAIARANQKPFPVNYWFNNLDDKDKGKVVLFIAMDNRENCSDTERENLKAVEDQLKPSQKKAFDGMKATERYDTLKFIEGMDIDKIRQMQSQFSEPFDSFRVGEELGLLD